MRRHSILTFAVLVAAGATAGPAAAQIDAYRGTYPLSDVNRSNRIIYAPIVRSYSGPRPADMPRDVSAAAWFRVAPGRQGLRPDLTRERARYRLQSFQAVGNGEEGRFRVVITRSPDPGDEELPELRLVHSDSGLGSTALPERVDDIAGGVRYTYTISHPYPPTEVMRAARERETFGIHFMPARDVELPRSLVGAPTFGQAPLEDRRSWGPPRLPEAERRTGKRIVYTSPRSAGAVVERSRVAGSRQIRRQ
jgi:hypothetical protein